MAVNLTGVHHGDVSRGDSLVRPDQWAPTTTFDASLQVLASLDHGVSRRGAYLLYAGSGEYPVRVRLIGAVPRPATPPTAGTGSEQATPAAGGQAGLVRAAEIPPGGLGFIRCHLPVALPLLPGDRYVLRESGRSETVGGGEVLDVAPVLAASRARPSISVDRVVAERGWVDADLLERMTGRRMAPVVGHWVVAPAALAAAQQAVLDAVAAAGPQGVDLATLSVRAREALPSLSDQVVVRAGRAVPAGTGATERIEELRRHPWVEALRARPWAPPEPNGVDRQVVRELVRHGLVVERDGVYFAAEAIQGASKRVAQLLAESPEGVTVAQVRTALGNTRKHVLPLLAELDATGVTRRRGDMRIGGPRLPNGSG